jgi:hypothetical protein
MPAVYFIGIYINLDCADVHATFKCFLFKVPFPAVFIVP